MSKSKQSFLKPDNRSPLDTAPISPAAPAMPLRRVHWIATVLILLHFLAVLAATNVASPPTSQLWLRVASLFRPYVAAADLNHGYRFFCAEPGPSHLVQYELTLADGKVQTGRFPDLREQSPRLLYHRYFMLAEHLNGFYGAWQQIVEQLEDPNLPPASRRNGEGGERRRAALSGGRRIVQPRTDAT